MGLSPLSWANPKYYDVADLTASIIPAWAQHACPRELDVAFSLDQRGAMACVMSELASSKNRAPT